MDRTLSRTFLNFDGDKVPDIWFELLRWRPAKRPARNCSWYLWEEYAFRAGTVGTVAAKTAMDLSGLRAWLWQILPEKRSGAPSPGAAGVTGSRSTPRRNPFAFQTIWTSMTYSVRYPADDVTAEWRTTRTFHDIDDVLKLDVLGHDDPTMIRKLQDLSGTLIKWYSYGSTIVMDLFLRYRYPWRTPIKSGLQLVCLYSQFGTNFVRGTDLTDDLCGVASAGSAPTVLIINAQDLIKAE